MRRLSDGGHWNALSDEVGADGPDKRENERKRRWEEFLSWDCAIASANFVALPQSTKGCGQHVISLR